MCNKTNGTRAEQFFVDKLREFNIKPKFVNKWYDFEVEGQKVEVKSASISIKQNKLSRRVGRFDFHNTLNRMIKENVWICFIVRYKNDFILLGLTKASNRIGKRISIHKIYDMQLLKINDWLNKI